MSAAGFGKFQFLVLAYAGLGAVVDAMEVMILSFIGPSVKSVWGLSSAQESLITTVVFAGMLVGAYFWGIVADNCGRRKGLLSVAVVTTVTAFLSAFSPNYISLLVLRMLVGTGLAGGPVYSSWFLEFVPPENRGLWMVIFSTFWTVGTVLEALLAWIIMPNLGWRWLLGLSSVPCFATLAFYGWTIESPRYLCTKGRVKDAYNVLKKVAAVNQTELPFGMLVCDNVPEANEELLSRQRNKFANYKAAFSSLFPLFSSRLIRTTLLIWVVYFGNSFLYYGVILLTSELSSGEARCISTTSNLNDDYSLYRDTFITSLAELPGLVLSAVLVDKAGRKMSLVLMYGAGFLFLLPLVIHEHEFLTTVLLFGARMCFIGTFTVAGIYCPEIYPTSVRTTGVGVASAVGRIAGMICPVVAVQFISGCEMTAAILLFEAVAIVSGVGALLFPLETKGRKLTDIVSS
nr:organic cation/carnitine transporter 7-like [Ipomoea batatas]